MKYLLSVYLWKEFNPIQISFKRCTDLSCGCCCSVEEYGLPSCSWRPTVFPLDFDSCFSEINLCRKGLVIVRDIFKGRWMWFLMKEMPGVWKHLRTWSWAPSPEACWVVSWEETGTRMKADRLKTKSRRDFIVWPAMALQRSKQVSQITFKPNHNHP